MPFAGLVLGTLLAYSDAVPDAVNYLGLALLIASAIAMIPPEPSTPPDPSNHTIARSLRLANPEHQIITDGERGTGWER